MMLAELSLQDLKRTMPQATLMIGFPTRPQANNAASNLDNRVQIQDATKLCDLAKISQVFELSKVKSLTSQRVNNSNSMY